MELAFLTQTRPAMRIDDAATELAKLSVFQVRFGTEDPIEMLLDSKPAESLPPTWLSAYSTFHYPAAPMPHLFAT